MNLNDLTLGDIQKLQSMFNTSACSKNHPYSIGMNYFIRTVTFHYTGRLVEVFKDELVLENAAWVADDGRFQQALEKCEYNEVELYPQDQKVVIGRGAILDAVIVGKTPVSQK
jgi:hypothetical protein